ncbi:MAG: hypothetical protein JW742_03980 [Candidatus Aminicenantes bacterium]|nr:hypothetical protein [Candidatus Aminicenantes bacterium]
MAFLPLVVVFSLLGAVSAFLITYEECRRHCPDRKFALRIALKTAGIAFVFLSSITTIVLLLLARIY